jgi:phenylpropionate dioxygenase-like ring-hydroxylating dioxygenase large terminal subunit
MAHDTKMSADDLLKGLQDDLDAGLLPLRVFNDAEIFELELRRIFARSWVFIGHETEIPKPGDYALRYIGRDPFIFVRDQSGSIQVLYNACRHRGSQLCRVEKGNARSFTCPYHGWTYRTDGKLIAVPSQNEGYKKLQLSDWSLFPAHNVANYHGLIFANLDPNAIPFEQHLGKYRWYLDMQCLLTEGGMEVIGEPHRWQVNANWKQGAENFNGDSSHTSVTHRSALQVGVAGGEAVGALGKSRGVHVSECDGHAISMRVLETERTAFWMYPEEVTRHVNRRDLSAAQIDIARRSIVHDGTVFPNFSFIQIGVTDSNDRPPAGFLSFRTWQPLAPGKTEIWNWILAPKESSPEYKRRAYRVGMSSFSPSGSFEPDDIAVFGSIATSASTVFAEMNEVKLNYQMGLPGMGDIEPIKDWPGPGHAAASNAGEEGLRTFHRSWYRHMMAPGRS